MRERPFQQAHPMRMNEKPGHPSFDPPRPVNPTRASEARITKVMYGERTLRSPQDCDVCAKAMRDPNFPAPYHDASDKCEGSGYSHCSCSVCF